MGKVGVTISHKDKIPLQMTGYEKIVDVSFLNWI